MGRANLVGAIADVRVPVAVLVRLCLSIFLLNGILAGGAHGQRRRGYPTPPAPVADGPVQPGVKLPGRHLDTVAIDREAKEMAALASSVSGDIEQVKKGLLPSPLIEKLKRIEKLSKQLRGQIQP